MQGDPTHQTTCNQTQAEETRPETQNTNLAMNTNAVRRSSVAGAAAKSGGTNARTPTRSRSLEARRRRRRLISHSQVNTHHSSTQSLVHTQSRPENRQSHTETEADWIDGGSGGRYSHRGAKGGPGASKHPAAISRPRPDIYVNRSQGPPSQPWSHTRTATSSPSSNSPSLKHTAGHRGSLTVTQGQSRARREPRDQTGRQGSEHSSRE